MEDSIAVFRVANWHLFWDVLIKQYCGGHIGTQLITGLRGASREWLRLIDAPERISADELLRRGARVGACDVMLHAYYVKGARDLCGAMRFAAAGGHARICEEIARRLEVMSDDEFAREFVTRNINDDDIDCDILGSHEKEDAKTKHFKHRRYMLINGFIGAAISCEFELCEWMREQLTLLIDAHESRPAHASVSFVFVRIICDIVLRNAMSAMQPDDVMRLMKYALRAKWTESVYITASECVAKRGCIGLLRSIRAYVARHRCGALDWENIFHCCVENQDKMQSIGSLQCARYAIRRGAREIDEELADLSDISRATLGFCACGKRSTYQRDAVPDMRAIGAICSAFARYEKSRAVRRDVGSRMLAQVYNARTFKWALRFGARSFAQMYEYGRSHGCAWQCRVARAASLRECARVVKPRAMSLDEMIEGSRKYYVVGNGHEWAAEWHTLMFEKMKVWYSRDRGLCARSRARIYPQSRDALRVVARKMRIARGRRARIE